MCICNILIVTLTTCEIISLCMLHVNMGVYLKNLTSLQCNNKSVIRIVSTLFFTIELNMLK